MHRAVAIRGTRVTATDDLAAGVHRQGVAEAAAKGAEVDHPAGQRPGKRMTMAGDGTCAHDLAAGVHRRGEAFAAAVEGAEIDHSAGLRPRKRAIKSLAGTDVAPARADYLAVVVHRQG